MTRQDGGTEFPTWAILAPCSRPSRTLRAAVGDGPRPFLTATVRNALHHCRRGRRNGLRPNKETVDPETVNSGTALPSDRSALVSWHIFRWALLHQVWKKCTTDIPITSATAVASAA